MKKIFSKKSNWIFAGMVAVAVIVSAFQQGTPTVTTTEKKPEAKTPPKKNPCMDVNGLKKASKSEMDPYTYDSGQMKQIMFQKKPILVETEVPLSLFGKYRLVFNTTGLPKKVNILIYNKDKEHKKRELLWSTSSDSLTSRVYHADFKNKSKVFVNYNIPADSSRPMAKGCVYLMLGYK